MDRNIESNFSRNPHKDAVQDVFTILLSVQESGNEHAIALVDGILGDLLTGLETPKEAIRRAKEIQDSLKRKLPNKI